MKRKRVEIVVVCVCHIHSNKCPRCMQKSFWVDTIHFNIRIAPKMDDLGHLQAKLNEQILLDESC